MRQVLLLSHLTDDKPLPESPPAFITLHWLLIFSQSKFKLFERSHKDLQILTPFGLCSLLFYCLLPQALSLLTCFLGLCAFAHTSPLPETFSPSPHRLDGTTPGGRIWWSLSQRLSHLGGTRRSSVLPSVPQRSYHPPYWGYLSLCIISLPTPVFLSGKSHEQRSLASLASMGLQSWTRLSN